MSLATDIQPSWIIPDGDNMPILDVRAIVTPLLEEDFGSNDYDDLAETVLMALRNPGNLRISIAEGDEGDAAPVVMRTVMWGVNGPILAPLEGRPRSHKPYTRSVEAAAALLPRDLRGTAIAAAMSDVEQQWDRLKGLRVVGSFGCADDAWWAAVAMRVFRHVMAYKAPHLFETVDRAAGVQQSDEVLLSQDLTATLSPPAP